MDAKTLAHARKQHGHSLTQAAAACGVTEGTWRLWERGEGCTSRTPAILERVGTYLAEAERIAEEAR
jgi:transcriptional regulator with XRE-family HTH domain